jgi:hypothetical protein
MHMTIKGRDIVALCVLASCVWLLSHGIDTIVGYTLLGVVCGYFGIEIIPPRIGRKTKGGK